ncbi:MAG: lipid-A-disaccharide synthase [Candidatus Aminicenantes bacterium]|nr:lipid-A-disaccharide synthase [Candidatus Aminicenantes bacterium]
MTSVLIVAGENSGEQYGAGLVRAVRRIRTGVRFFGIGGREMDRAGVEILHRLEDLAVVGVFEVLSRLPRLRGIFRSLVAEAQVRRPAAAVLIDSPDFNLRLAKKLKAAGVPVLYYVSPTVWAWRRGRLKTIRRAVSRMLLIFPFEQALYDRAGISATYVGHPLSEYLTVRRPRERFLRSHGLNPRHKLVAVLPGSRKGEVERHMSVLTRGLALLKARMPLNVLFVLAENLDPQILSERLPPGLKDANIVSRNRYEALAAADLVLSACGTANLEAAMLGRPLVTFYRISPLTYFFGRRLVRINRFSIVNILAGRDVVPELIQTGFTPEAVCDRALEVLTDAGIRKTMDSEFRRLRKMMGRKKPSLAAARELGKLLDAAEPSRLRAEEPTA